MRKQCEMQLFSYSLKLEPYLGVMPPELARSAAASHDPGAGPGPELRGRPLILRRRQLPLGGVQAHRLVRRDHPLRSHDEHASQRQVVLAAAARRGRRAHGLVQAALARRLHQALTRPHVAHLE